MSLTDAEKLALATTFNLLPQGAEYGKEDADMFAVSVVRRSHDRFAILWRGQCWDGEKWIYENLPSERTDKFKAKTRWPRDEALEMALDLVEKTTINNWNFNEFKEHMWKRRQILEQEAKDKDKESKA